MASRSLVLGASGDDVAQLHRWLRDYGYFPNSSLQDAHPMWRPIVADAPTDERTFDEYTLRAVKALQRNTGLPVTGEVDAATRAQMAGRACGAPDGIQARAEHGDNRKFSLGARPSKSTYSWKLLNADTFDLSYADTLAAVRRAFAAWASVTTLTFQEVDALGTADFTLKFEEMDGYCCGNPAAGGLRASADTGTGIIRFDLHERWTTSWPPSGGATDVELTATHEIGHLLRLGHSSVNAATMRNDMMLDVLPATRTLLYADDRVAAGVFYDTWQELAGGGRAYEVAVSSGTANAVWAIGTDSKPGGGSGIHRWSGSTWSAAPSLPGDMGARAVAVDRSGRPWVLAPNGDVYCRTSAVTTSGTWKKQPDCATDIAIGSDDTIWAIRCGSLQPIKWLRSEGCNYTHTAANPWPWSPGSLPVGQTAKKIAVNRAGVPWIIDNQQRIFRRDSASTTGTVAWQEVPGAGRATDITIDLDNYTYALGIDQPLPSNYGIWVFNEQRCIHSTIGSPQCAAGVVNPGDNGAPARAEWVPMRSGFGLSINAGLNGPYITTSDRRIWRTLR